jgi:hypothetical protein
MRLLFLLLFALAGAFSAYADTLGNYTVYLRGKQIGRFNEGQMIRVVMKRDSVSTFDTLRIDVYGGERQRCKDCTYSLLVFGSQGPMLIDTAQTGEDFFVPLAPLAEQSRKNGTKQFHGYYTEFRGNAARSRVVSFEIRLE